LEELLRLTKEQLEVAKKRQRDAEIALKMAEEAGIDVTQLRVDYETAKADIERIRKAYERAEEEVRKTSS